MNFETLTHLLKDFESQKYVQVETTPGRMILGDLLPKKHNINFELVHHILEERSIYWIDDLPFVATIIIGQIKSQERMNPSLVFKDISDKNFAVGLFRNTINNDEEYKKIIVRFSRNWDIERIAIMDQLFLKMAFAEIYNIF